MATNHKKLIAQRELLRNALYLPPETEYKKLMREACILYDAWDEMDKGPPRIGKKPPKAVPRKRKVA